jgi:PAS domain S-box-containing protein
MKDPIILTLIIFPLILLFFFILFIRVLKGRKKEEELEKRTEMSFVVDTFHDLVRQLKEKEHELEELKKKAEQKAEDIESYSENIIQSVPSGVVSFDTDLVITKTNIAATKILKIEPEDMIGKPYHKVFRSPLKEIIESEKNIKRAECLYKDSKGQEIWLGLTKTDLLNSKAERIGYILIFTDITDIKSLESQIRLKEHLSSIGELSLGIAHELRNPMGVISGYTKMLMKDRQLAERPEIKAIYKEIQIMDRIISDFMSFAKPVTPTLTEVNIEDMVEGIVQHFLKDSSDITVDCLFYEKVLRTDEVLLRQAIANLIQNAIEAMPKGGKLSILTDRIDNSFIMKISDTGYGIPEEMRDKIFQPFFSKKEKGTGLGLAIVQKNITMLDGKVEFSSSSKGTTFTIVLPQK